MFPDHILPEPDSEHSSEPPLDDLPPDETLPE
jgi:hypothetical protein